MTDGVGRVRTTCLGGMRGREVIAAGFILGAGCGGPEGITEGIDVDSALGPSARRERAAAIRDFAGSVGLTNGALLAGIADAETGMAHCWSEATWTCQGPAAQSCGGGPIVAGAADGPCSARQGGLGMFQFDAGTFDDTIRREGAEVVELDGNIRRGVAFVVAMVRRSVHVPVPIASDQDALDWLNSVPVDPDNEVFQAWIKTTVHYYNGCVPGRCGVYEQRYNKYESHTLRVFNEFGDGFWGDVVAPEPPPPCEEIPADGMILDDDSRCIEWAGAPAGWKRIDSGFGGGARYTWGVPFGEEDNVATWQLAFAQEGDYRVEAYVDGAPGQTQNAHYEIVGLDGEPEVVVVDQSEGEGFRTLGTFRFGAGDGQHIRLADTTGDLLSDRVEIIFDAIRILPVLPEMGEGPEDPAPPAGDVDDGESPWIDGQTDPGTDPLSPKDAVGCRGTGPIEGEEPWSALGALAMCVSAIWRHRIAGGAAPGTGG